MNMNDVKLKFKMLILSTNHFLISH